MQEVKFGESDYERHNCTSERKGDWIIFSCSQCDYRRRFNWRTQKMIVNGGDMQVMHNGEFIPVGINPANQSPN